jgi:hypothetical protein
VPLWPSSDATDALVPPDLIERLLAWQSDFDGSFHPEREWLSHEAKERWATSSAELEAELREALSGKAELVVDLWPLGQKERHYPKG